MKRLLFCALLGVALVGTGCDSSSETDTYSVTLSDEDSAPVYTGELRLVFEEETARDGPHYVQGSWRLEGHGGHPSPIPDTGIVNGSRLGVHVGLTLDFGASDSGLSLSGLLDGERITGEWSAITIGGPMPGGAFEAVRE